MMRILSCNTVVAGAGAAGLNAADELAGMGVNTLLVADSLSGGTSRNAGSDKQTYYKLALSGNIPDSVDMMARTLFSGGGMHGDHAYAMAASSARGFLKLELLGVPFPHNEWGEFTGYQTDHDTTGSRATSAGPLTGQLIADALMKSARSRNVRMIDGLKLAAILIDPEGAARGLLMLDSANPAEPFVLINARHILLCTGGPRAIYHDTVYPGAQSGATGAAIRAGAAVSNLCYWQYGVASVKVKWNVSGSYQQALPAYTDGEREFLPPHFNGAGDMLDSVFMKGYQWPFDSRKRTGSSRVDMAVKSLRSIGGKAFLDFTREPAGGVSQYLGETAMEYLTKCGAFSYLPINRLRAINPKAIEFYANNGIDLKREALEIAVCAQHSNGGIKIDHWWRSTVKNLYAAGECAAAFGIYRPGGSALNETQAGSYRAARHISAHGGRLAPLREDEFMSAVNRCLERELLFFSSPVDSAGASKRALTGMPKRMDDCAGPMRSVTGMRKMLGKVKILMSGGRAFTDHGKAIELRDMLAVQRAALSAMIKQSEYAGDAGHVFTDHTVSPDAPEASGYAFETSGDMTVPVPVRPIPEGGGWFETVWKEYLQTRADYPIINGNARGD